MDLWRGVSRGPVDARQATDPPLAGADRLRTLLPRPRPRDKGQNGWLPVGCLDIVRTWAPSAEPQDRPRSGNKRAKWGRGRGLISLLFLRLLLPVPDRLAST